MADTSGNSYGLYRSDRGFFQVGSGAGAIILPIQEGAGMAFPDKFIDVPGTANNVYDVSFYQGLYYPTARVPVDVLASWFTAANLNAWFVTRGPTRGEKGYDDLFIIPSGCSFSDGKRLQVMNNVKGASMSLSTRQNDIIRASLGFMGASFTEGTWAAVTPPVGARASFGNFLTVSGVDGITDWSLSIDNRTSPSPIMGTAAGTAAIEINAARPRVTLNIMVDAAGTYPTNLGDMVFTITPPLANGGAGTAVTFEVLKARINQPDNIEKRDTRAAQMFSIVAQSVDGVSFPIIIS